MTYNVAINHPLGAKVNIPELKTMGRVNAIFITMKAVQYQVRYFMNGELKEVYFLEDEILPT